MNGSNLGCDRKQLLSQRIGARWRQAHAAAKRIMVREQSFNLVVERVRLRQVHETDRASGDLVLVGRPDAAFGGADLGSANAG